MDNNYEVTNQQNLTQEQQQKAYYDAMLQIKEEEKNKKKQKRKKKLIILGAILCFFALLIGGNILKTILFPENIIGNVAISNHNLVSYTVNENTNSDRDDYVEKVQNQISTFVGEDDISDNKIQKKLYKQGKRAYKSKAYLGAIQIWENCTEYKDTQDLLDETHYEVAELYKEQQSFSYAASHYEKSNGYADSVEQAKECNYQFALYELKEGKYSTACLYIESNELLDYKEARKAYLWGTLYTKFDKTVNSVKTAVRSSCKDPSSYIDYGVDVTYTFKENKKENSKADFSITVKHTYSATNSFGGRITDSYSYTTDVSTIDLYGMTYDEAYRVAQLSIDSLLKECGYTY